MLFSFSSWESPSWRSDLIKHARTQFKGYSLQLVRLDLERTQSNSRSARERGWLFFGSPDRSDDANFVVTLPCDPPFVTEHLGVAYFGDDSPIYLRQLFQNALQQGHFARVFFLDQKEELRELDAASHYLLLVGSSGWGQWQQLNPTSQGTSWSEGATAFRWTTSPNLDQFLSTPALQLWEHIAAQKADFASDCAFARRALDWTHQAMGSQLVQWSKGSSAELTHVLRAALLAQPERWSGANAFEWIIKFDKLRGTWLSAYWMPFGLSFSSSYPLAPDSFHGILSRVTPSFETSFNEQLLAEHLEAARWAHRYEETLTISIENPTAHERLEAALFWQQWQDSHPLTTP